jgi:hypothetical protein
LPMGFDRRALMERSNSGEGQIATNPRSLALLEPLNEIEPSHWKDYQIDASTLYVAAENSEVCTYNQSSSDWKAGGFVDLHLNRRAGAKWLRREAPQFKGRHAARQKRQGR